MADLDLTNNTALESLECGGNEFTTLDLSQNTNLKSFGFFNGKLSSLNLTHNTNLEELYFCGNNFSTISYFMENLQSGLRKAIRSCLSERSN